MPVLGLYQDVLTEEKVISDKMFVRSFYLDKISVGSIVQKVPDK